MSIRRPKSIVTDYRPPGAGRARTTGAPPARPGAAASRDCWDKKASNDAAEAANHDKWVADLPLDLLLVIANDLCARFPADRRDPEQRWTMGRTAAVLRRLSRERVNLSPSP